MEDDALFAALEDLTQDGSFHDAMERLYLMSKVETGLRQLEAGEAYGAAAAWERLPRPGAAAPGAGDCGEQGVRWAHQALGDLEAVYALLARDTEAYAELLVEELFGQTEALAEGGEPGQALPQLGPDLYALGYGAFRLIYRRAGEAVQILACAPGCH